MSTASKLKWLVSMVLGALVLVLALVGGKWGTTYASDSGVLTAPVVDRIVPNKIPVGSQSKVVIIVGANFNQCSIWPRITDPGLDVILDTLQILPDAISVPLDASYFSEPTVYSVTVVNSIYCTAPVAPYLPEWDEISNAVTLTIFEPVRSFLPIVRR